MFYRHQMMSLFPLLLFQDSPGFLALQWDFPAHTLSLLLFSPPHPFVVKFTVHLQQRRLSPAVCPSEVIFPSN